MNSVVDQCENEDYTFGMDDAMLRVSDESRGFFPTLDFSNYTRDTRFPIRATYQFYKVSDTNVISENDFDYISQKIKKIYDLAETKGSLVLTESNRPTVSNISTNVSGTIPSTYTPSKPLFNWSNLSRKRTDSVVL